jgi:hypothetical protein
LILSNVATPRYYELLDRSPVYYAAVALHPEMKFEYFEQEWEDKPDWIARAKSETKRLWERDYKGSTVGPAPGASPGARENDLLHGIGSFFPCADLPHGPC